ncbi:hypothetical protein GUJ93_ZPchr0004g39981 [Zizania palustris]|uniref:Uncharacterized protein n=1 Tax=Zizania palustris TaxID=103762 RepID=A0A8J5VFG7_ZIZPA|nr:hypothetical protein GUJ93_ZPchr0004g39981 [Zizania palustris]
MQAAALLNWRAVRYCDPRRLNSAPRERRELYKAPPPLSTLPPTQRSKQRQQARSEPTKSRHKFGTKEGSNGRFSPGRPLRARARRCSRHGAGSGSCPGRGAPGPASRSGDPAACSVATHRGARARSRAQGRGHAGTHAVHRRRAGARGPSIVPSRYQPGSVALPFHCRASGDDPFRQQ